MVAHVGDDHALVALDGPGMEADERNAGEEGHPCVEHPIPLGGDEGHLAQELQ